MSFETMTSRLTGYITRLPKSEAYNMVNDAWTDVRNDRLWSFQLVEDSIATPNVVNAGTFSTTQGSNIVTADATATTALTGLINPFITLRQFRITSGGIYNIVGVGTSGLFTTLILDRPYTDPTGTLQSYQVYQCYFAAPVADFKRWLDWRDLTNGDWLDVYKVRREINRGDPQRLYFSFPKYVLPFSLDQRPNSATLGWPFFELYPNPLSYVSYMRYWVRTGADLVNPSDTLPYPVTDKLVFARSQMLACRWAEANRDPSIPRGQGADYKFLYEAAAKEYSLELKLIGLKDRDLVDLFLSKLPNAENINRPPYYSTIAGRAYSGAG